jgi:hypothetical protein
MSQRNGDKARFNKMRKKAIDRRERQRILFAGPHVAQGQKDVGGGKASSGKQRVKPAS